MKIKGRKARNMSVQAHLDFTFSVNIPSIKRETLARDHVQVFCTIHEDFLRSKICNVDFT